MTLRKIASWLAMGLACATLTVVARAETAPASLSAASCLSCHDAKKPKIKVTGDEGGERALNAIKPDKYGKSVHAKMECVACHTEITDAAAPHQKEAAAKVASCAQCHEDLWTTLKNREPDRSQVTARHRRPEHRRLQEFLPRPARTRKTRPASMPPAPTATTPTPSTCRRAARSQRTDWHHDRAQYLRRQVPHRRTRGVHGLGARQGRPGRATSRRPSAPTATPPTTSATPRPTRSSWPSPRPAATATRTN